MYYTDHGEQIYDDSRRVYGRTFGRFVKEGVKSVYEIPFVIWVSNSFKEYHPDLLNRIGNSVDKPFSSDDVPYVLFDLAGIDFEGSHMERSVISDSFRHHDRLLFMNDITFNYDRSRKELDALRLLVPCK